MDTQSETSVFARRNYPALERKIIVEDIIIFVTLPNRKTPYHIDRECNFLLQIRGEENHNNVSISLSVNFQLRDALKANAYGANYISRRRGIKPTPPGQSEWLDSVKSAAATPGAWAMKTYNEDEETWVAPAGKRSPCCKSGDSGNHFRPGAP